MTTALLLDYLLNHHYHLISAEMATVCGQKFGQPYRPTQWLCFLWRSDQP